MPLPNQENKRVTLYSIIYCCIVNNIMYSYIKLQRVKSNIFTRNPNSYYSEVTKSEKQQNTCI